MGRPYRVIRDEAQKEVAKVMDKLSGRYSRWEIWQDFVTMGAIGIANSVKGPYWEDREKMYLDRAKKYKPDELDALASMLAAVICGMEQNPDQDFLGELYMGLDMGNSATGQFFTPYHICHLISEMTYGDDLVAKVEEQGWISVNDPCCGGGALLLAFANVCKDKGINYQTDVLFVAQDIDFNVAMMCYIQLSLMGCAGYVKVGNSLTDPLTCYDDRALCPVGGGEIWYTPMYFRDVWQYRCLWAQTDMLLKNAVPSDDLPTAQMAETAVPEVIELQANADGQLTLF